MRTTSQQSSRRAFFRCVRVLVVVRERVYAEPFKHMLIMHNTVAASDTLTASPFVGLEWHTEKSLIIMHNPVLSYTIMHVRV
jgi:hypothetical protein